MNKPMMCRSCGKLMGIAASCPWCGASRPSKAQAFFSKNFSFSHLLVGEIFVKLTIGVFILEVIFSLIFYGPEMILKATWQTPGSILELMGASSPRLFEGRWWGPLTASWLHGGILHLIFNVMALKQICELIESTTSRSFTWLAYILTGCGGFVLSALAGHFSCGASASIFGLIGLGMSIAFLLGNGTSDPVFKALLSWAAMGLLFGFLFPSIDNTAHLGGLMSGGILGLIWAQLRTKKLFHSIVHKVVFLLWGLTMIGFVYSILITLQII
jgi:rhomboid protease GluP